MDIAALSETRFSKQGQTEEMGAGYTFFWSGCQRAVQREAGISLALRYDTMERPPCPPQRINDRLMSLRLLLWVGKFANSVSVCVLLIINSHEARAKLYSCLHTLLATMSRADKLTVLGDFNALVDPDHAAWRGVLGPMTMAGSSC
nr:unnamed protein product [Spirometra erinaceieuropaei]